MWIDSNQRQYSFPSSPRFPEPPAKCLFCLFPLCLSTLQRSYIIVLLCTKIHPQEEGGRTHYHSGHLFKLIFIGIFFHSGHFKAREIKPEATSPYSSLPIHHGAISNITYLHLHPLLYSALHPFNIHIQMCRILLIMLKF